MARTTASVLAQGSANRWRKVSGANGVDFGKDLGTVCRH